MTAITALFTDIGGVLLSNGWDRHARQRACETFQLDADDINERHHLTFDTYEEGKLSLDTYLNRVIFFKERSFTKNDFKSFMYAQSHAFEDMLDLLKKLKQQHQLKITAVSNEGRELTEHRVTTFKLGAIIDTFVSSCFVHVRKPDVDMFKIALDLTQVEAEQVIYLDDRPMFVEVAASLGIHSFVHKTTEQTRQNLAKFGLTAE